jgi:hypothetical protein
MNLVTGCRGIAAACAVGTACLVGCGGGAANLGPPPPTTPLTIAEWQTLDVEQKYWPETFERLRQGDPQLQDERAWNKFFAEVIVPARKVDIPLATPVSGKP